MKRQWKTRARTLAGKLGVWWPGSVKLIVEALQRAYKEGEEDCSSCRRLKESFQEQIKQERERRDSIVCIECGRRGGTCYCAHQ
jgi:recombinational DNA repair protein RecR